MTRKQPKMIRVPLSGDPYNSDLFCPFCGEQVLEAGGEGVEQCPHLIHADISMDDAPEFFSSDLGFVFFEPAPACREHFFIFREGDPLASDEDE